MGLRISEGLRLEIGDINKENLTVHIRNSKGNKDRLIKVPPLTYHYLKKWMNVHKHARLIFPAIQINYGIMSVFDKHMDIGSAQSAIKAACNECNFKRNVSAHTLRHSYATHLLEQGVSIIVVQKLLGHSCIKTTINYLHRTEIMEQDAKSAADKILNGFDFHLRQA